MEKTYAGFTINVNDEGYLTDMNQWNHEVAKEMAKEDGLELGNRHFDVLEYLRDKKKNNELHQGKRTERKDNPNQLILTL